MSAQNDPGVSAWRAMLLAHSAAIRAIDADLAQRGLIQLSWYDVLLELTAATDGRLRMKELTDRVVLSRTRISRLVDEMVQAELVTKTRDENDRRVVWAAITPSGRTALRAAAKVYMSGIHDHFSSNLTKREQDIVARALMKVHHAHQPPRTIELPATRR
ncbi:MarR family winged helix-turn-helix transcriptional regulator [Kribbella sp. CA-253562]|uniref:MarR family winged helix-turn-helix transcriptional regulator n=1 Tax=Kribbella sp. CA-253562 TaxID=3239942 RepID=UPI003D8AC9B5